MPNSHVIFIQRDNKLSPMDNALTPNNRKIQDKVEHLMVEMAELMKIVKNRR